MKYTVKFELFPQKSDCKPIRARVSYGGKRVELRTGYSIEPEKWDSAAMRVRSGFKNKYKQSGNEINKGIFLCQECIDAIFARYELLEKRAPTPTELKRAFDESTGKTSSKVKNEKQNVFAAYDKFIAEQSLLNSWGNSHKNRHVTVKNHLSEYNSTLLFDDITKEALIGFLNDLFDKGLCNTTISKLLDYLRGFLRWAFDEKYYTGNLHEKFKPQLKGADGSYKTVVYLTWDELMLLYNFSIPAEKKYLDRVRDVFCFCCFTGLRYSDAFNLLKTDVQRQRISVITQKTVDPLYVELNNYSTTLLKKYSELPIKKAMPVISNQKMNDYLKELGELAGITTPTKIVYFKNDNRYEEVHPKYAVLSTHCGRRTFIVLALSLGVPIQVIMKWTGHKSYTSMKPYIAIVDSQKEEEMKKFNKPNEPKNKPEK
ncbi:MAG: site-specific integrase [Prevotellaceae bacterium]|jgi:integrase|nr:site-specific integrase [Prevotellaceae bacterium]